MNYKGPAWTEGPGLLSPPSLLSAASAVSLQDSHPCVLDRGHVGQVSTEHTAPWTVPGPLLPCHGPPGGWVLPEVITTRSYQIRPGPKSTGRCPYKKRAIWVQTEGRRSEVDRDRGWRDVSVSEECQQPPDAREAQRICPGAFSGSTLALRLAQGREKLCSVVFNPTVWSFVAAAPGVVPPPAVFL